MICSACNETIDRDERTAHGPDGTIHYRCFKRGTAQGTEISLISLSEELGLLKRRVQDLEQIVSNVKRDIPRRIGP